MTDKEFLPVNIAILTISDSRSLAEDRSGDTLVARLEDAGHVLANRTIVKDERDLIADQYRQWIADPKIEIIISTGGTGLTGRDVTPEALSDVVEKDIPGFGELFRWLSFAKIKTSTIQSRACAGVANGTYIFALPGSPGACKDAWDDILIHQLDIRCKPCNFIEMLPRLTEHL
ncbi:MAG: molybdenum cofactor biosynthesis protein B [Rhodospirillales bacterium]|jgi:molybdopterin adenylyltransferase|nr:molybdenum cofactor biosynthesis protein B [Rhodospirillales bacterium]